MHAYDDTVQNNQRLLAGKPTTVVNTDSASNALVQGMHEGWRAVASAVGDDAWEKVARLAGIEPATLGFGGQYSIH